MVLVANPASGSTFLGWSGDCAGTGVCALTMNADHSVTAAFAGPNQPDAAVKSAKAAGFVGDDVLNTSGAGQTVLAKVKRGKSTSFDVLLTNRGSQPDTFTVHAQGDRKPFSVKYFDGGTDVTAAVVGGIYTTASVGVGSASALKIVVKASKRAETGATKTWLITATSSADGTALDAVGVSAKAK